MKCWSCKSEIDVGDKIGYRDTCPKCGAYLHCCVNCRFFSWGRYNLCSETSADGILDKEGPNFCEYFKVKEG
jgi:predicted RNA-binding Zn-ribbon protein involved in translation (DUF1610 family)